MGSIDSRWQGALGTEVNIPLATHFSLIAYPFWYSGLFSQCTSSRYSGFWSLSALTGKSGQMGAVGFNGRGLIADTYRSGQATFGVPADPKDVQ